MAVQTYRAKGTLLRATPRLWQIMSILPAFRAFFCSKVLGVKNYASYNPACTAGKMPPLLDSAE